MAKVVEVGAALDARAHPLRAEIDEIRRVVLGVDPLIAERWKWNAPSFTISRGDASAGVDLLTLMLRDDDRVLLVIHHPAAPEVTSALFKGDHADGRRFVAVRAGELAGARAELERIVRELVARSF